MNLKTLNLSELPWLPLEEKAKLPITAGIYFAIDSEGTVQYIGKSVNIRYRWLYHHRYNWLQSLGQVKVAYLIVDDINLLDDLEKTAIKLFKPILNNTKDENKPPKIQRQKSYIKNILGEVLERENITPYRFWKSLSIGQNTAYRLCNDPESIPSKKIMDKIHGTYNWLPGVYLVKK